MAGLGAAETVLRVAWLGEPRNFDPVPNVENPTIWASHNVMDNLVRLSDDSTHIEPDLAESWEISDDHLTYTFHLRRGVRFHNGDEVTAEDVVFSLSRSRDPEQCPYSDMFKPIKDVVAVGRYTVRVELNAPYAPILANLSMFNTAIIPKKYFEEIGGSEEFARKPVGAGPFKFEYWKPGEEVGFSRFEDYWRKGQPKVDKLIYYVMPDAAARTLALRDGSVDVAVYVPWSEIAVLEADPNFKVSLDRIWRSDMIRMNHTVKPFNDVRVRQALNYAVNKQGIIDAVLFRHGELAASYLPRIRYYNDQIKPYPYDPEKARQLLKEAGYEKGFKTTLDCNAGDPLAVSVATIVQQNLRDIGIEVAIQKLEEGTRSERVLTLQYELGTDFYTSDSGDDDMLTDFGIVHSGNQAFWTEYRNPTVELLAELGRTILDDDMRRRIYHELQRIAHEDAVWLFLMMPPSPTGMRANVEGFVLPASHFYRWEHVSLK